MRKAVSKAKQTSEQRPTWAQAYVLAAFCLFLGAALGYLFRGSESSAKSPEVALQQPASTGSGLSLPNLLGSPSTLAGLNATAAPMLEALKRNPADFQSLVNLGNLYYDGHDYEEAIQYYGRALKIRPDVVEVRTDMGTAYWYTGNADRALAEFDRSIKLRPGHAPTLFNIGIVQWQGKHDVYAAVAAWEELLAKNPGYPERDKVMQMMRQAKAGG